VARIHRRLSWIACAWLSCQLSLLAAAPLSLSAHGPEAPDAITCTCAHTGNVLCPMHHPANPKPGCECKNSTDPGAANLVALLGPIAVLAGAPARLTPPSITQSPIHSISKFSDFIPIPAGPPPRA
jgi:hypothetical protein